MTTPSIESLRILAMSGYPEHIMASPLNPAMIGLNSLTRLADACQQTWRGTAETVKVEADENGWELHITDDLGRSYVFNVHGISEQVQAAGEEIARYWQEGREAANQHQRDLDAARELHAIQDEESLAVLGRCPHGTNLDTDLCPHGCRV